MSFSTELQAEPWRHDMFVVLRHFESRFRDKPRIGDSATRADEYILISQDPYLEYPASTLAGAVEDPAGRMRLMARFLGMFGPQGALPLATTEETYWWLRDRDDAFPRFVDIIQSRFLQLFYRAWADPRPIVQHDRPETDRFMAYIGSMIGIGTKPYRDADSLPDLAKLEFAGLIAPRIKSASRLKSLIEGLFDVTVEVDEFVGSWLSFEPSDTTQLGRHQSGLGQDCIVGASMFSVQDKIRLRVYVRDFAQYERFLPVGEFARQLNDAVFLYIGEQTDWDIELAIPAGEVTPVRIGMGSRLGWSTWMAPNWTDSDRTIRTDTRFHLASRFASDRAAGGRHLATGDTA